MELFRIAKDDFRFLGMDSNRSRCNGKSAITIIIFGLSIALGVTFLFLEAPTFLEFTINIYATAVLTVCCGAFTTILFKKKKLFALIADVEKFINKKYKSPTSKAIYDDSIQFVEKWSKLGRFALVELSAAGMIFPKVFFSYAIYFTTDVGRDAFQLPFFFWYPFDCNHPLGYLVAVTIQFIATKYCLIFVSCGLLFEIGDFILIVTMTKDVKNDLKIVNKYAKMKGNRVLALHRLSDFIVNDSVLRRFVYDHSDIYQAPHVMCFLWSLITICGAMLWIQMQIRKLDVVVLLMISVFMVYAFGLLLGICEFGQQMTDAFEEIDDRIMKLNWYMYPHALQRMLPTIMLVAQQPVEIKCFGSISILRVYFKQIANGAFSYFMTIRQFLK